MHQIRYGRAAALDIFNDTTTDDLDLLDDGIWPVDGLLLAPIDSPCRARQPRLPLSP